MDPILDPEDRDLEEGLMRAGRGVGMSAQLRERTLTALAMGTLSVTAASTAKAGTWGWFTSKAGALWVTGIVGIGGVLAIATGMSEAPSESNSGARNAHTKVSQKIHVDHAAEMKEVEADDPPKAAQMPTEANVIAPTESKSVDPGKANPTAPSPSNKASALSEELQHVSGVEAALRAGNPRQALTLLEQYRNKFQHPRLGLEAEVLTIQALYESGSVTAARARAQRFLVSYPKSPLGARARQFLK